MNQKKVQRLIKRHGIALFQTGLLRTGIGHVYIGRSCQDGIETCGFQCHQCSHDLCQTRRIYLCKNILCIEHIAVIQIKKSGRGRFRYVLHFFWQVIPVNNTNVRSKRTYNLCRSWFVNQKVKIAVIEIILKRHAKRAAAACKKDAARKAGAKKR